MNWRTSFLLLVTLVGGLVIIFRTSRAVGDPRVKRLGIVFVITLGIVMALAAAWSAHLAAGGEKLEGDQERFYFQAADLAVHHFRLSGLPSLNYTGVLFVYGLVFAVFGHNPYAPALVNLILVLVTTLFMLRVGYAIKGERGSSDWILGFAIVIPEVLLHIVMPSRDILAMVLLTIALVTVAGLIVGGVVNRSMGAGVVIGAMALLAIVRTTALLPAVLSIVLLLIAGRKIKPAMAPWIAIAAIGAILLAPILSERLGGYHLSYARLFSETVDANQQVLDIFNWHRRSIGRLLIPHNTLQAIAFTPPRLLLYLLAPLPSLGFAWRDLVAGDWSAIQNALVLASAPIYVALFPFAIASLWQSIAGGRGEYLFHIPFWITILAIVGGTALIHERYRIMAVPLLAGCVWLGRMATRRRLLWSFAIWGGVLFVGGGMAAAYKRLPCDLPAVTSEPGPVVITRGQPVSLTIRVNGSNVAYQWFAGNTGFTGAPIRGATGPSVRVDPEVTSGYWLRLWNECGQTDSHTILVTVR